MDYLIRFLRTLGCLAAILIVSSKCLFAVDAGSGAGTDAPVVKDMTPADRSCMSPMKPQISATYSAKGGIDLKSVKMLLDNAPVSAEVTESGITYSLEVPLEQGLHKVSLHVANAQGQATDAS